MDGIAPRLLHTLVCPKTGAPLQRRGEALVAGESRYPIVRGVPRFVAADAYAASFSFEWTTHDRTQLDCFTGSSDSAATFTQKTGLVPDDLAGKLVLDAGIGAGRFTDVMSRWGAEVVGVDLSYAVEAAARNFRDRRNVLVAQADIGALPFRPGTFDVIVSIGVLHHTPDTRRYFEALVPLLKPGGSIAIWVYPRQDEFVTRSRWIPFTSRIPTRMFYAWCRWFVPFALRREGSVFTRSVMSLFPFSNQGLGIENDILDTFDGYSPRHHGIHEPAEVEGWFRACGLVDVAPPGGVLTSMRGRKPEAEAGGAARA